MLIWFNEYELTDQSTINSCCGYNMWVIELFYKKLRNLNISHDTVMTLDTLRKWHTIGRPELVVLSRDTPINTKLVSSPATTRRVTSRATRSTSAASRPVAARLGAIPTTQHSATSTKTSTPTRSTKASTINQKNLFPLRLSPHHVQHAIHLNIFSFAFFTQDSHHSLVISK